jgi:hypothetical protein
MTLRRLSAVLAAIFSFQPAVAQPPPEVAVSIRAVLHDPTKPMSEFFAADQNGVVNKINLIQEGLSEARQIMPVNGFIVLYNTASVDPKKPEGKISATVKVPAGLRKTIAIIVPGPADKQPPFRVVLIDDSPNAFKRGESRAVSLVPVETALQAGEHKLQVEPGKIVSVPPVRKVNEFNMAQANFYYKEGDNWVAFTERQLQFLDDFRRIFLIHVTPGATQPFVSTVLDAAPHVPR